MAFQITDANFESDVIEKGGVSVLDFWAEWCGPCKMISPIIDKLSESYGDKALIGKVDVDNNPQVAMKYRVMSIPTIIILKDGKEVKRHVGYTSQANLEKLIDEQLAA